MSEQIIITIDGKECACEKGEYVFDVAKRNGIDIPGYCRSEAIADHRACCRMCIVEVETRGRSKIVASCVYPVDGPCNVSTKSERIEEDRTVLRALMKERMGDSEAKGFERLMEIDNDKCILCGLCVQACEALGTGAISLVDRGVKKDVNTPYNKASLDCIGCASCANICPMNAIPVTETDTTRFIWHREFTLVKCEKCGAVLGTQESIDHARKGASAQFADEALLCDACRREGRADILSKVYAMA